ncbi:FeFe-hydrogenase assembly protein HydE [Spironucleus salmonicida]|uniref:FeFe-hydrogenase assembly protein HydE n=1 Tax=Spironucleus salmonicida TaxID=348837 RepID=K7RUJ3_9EUKA|nr:FeFe-hydrogenase assembly protein HydE [Spironucleus salmonicida]KAH0573289.1 FeFe-hydrogenase assembly protein HydE [Spironucleus salmonicida]|eukprot:EST44954.1 [FeFe]-hydrogenase assembly protein HydE [Spironucleus salmonicida]
MLPTAPTLTDEILAKPLTLASIDYLLKRKNQQFEDAILYDKSEQITLQTVGRNVNLRAIIEFSNACALDCDYCGIRKSSDVERFLLDRETILGLAQKAIDMGYPGLLLQAGEIVTQGRVDFVADLAREIKKMATKQYSKEQGFRIIGSIGELSFGQYKQLKDAGIDRYLLRIESSNPELYAKIHPKEQRFYARDACLDKLKALDFMVGTGVLIGLPEQTTYDLARDIMYFKRKGADMIGMGPYLPAKGTPLAEKYDRKQIETNLHTENLFDTIKRMIAVNRIYNPKANISATTAMETIQANGRVEAIKAGANVVMPVLTPQENKVKYSLYEGKNDVKSSLDILKNQIESAGRTMDLTIAGDPLSWVEHLNAKHRSK